MSLRDTIIAKREGRALSDGQIAEFVQGLASGEAAPEMISALAMAIFLRGMDFAETASLTRAMTRSGAVIDWGADALPGPTLDKHSTGGVGDKVSLILAPIVAACGGYVPMIVGRGLAHTGGTLDKMGTIPGYDPLPPLDRFAATVREAGCAIIGQTGQLAPADARLYAVRDVTGTVESLPLITASILSKKLAAGVSGLVMDIKTGSGAFMRTEADARALSAAMSGTAREMGLAMRTVVSDMGECLGRTAGNALEVRESIDHLTGADREPRLHAVTIALAAEMLVLGKLAKDEAEGAAMAEAAIASGAAAERFGRMVAALGGPADLVERPERHLAAAPMVRPVLPGRSGWLAAVDARALGEALIDLGGGRRRLDDPIDPAPGFSDVLPIGSAISPDRPLALVHARDAASAERGVADYLRACHVSEEPVDAPPVIHAVLR